MNGSQINIGANNLTSGEAVVYENGQRAGTQNGNLTVGNTYYVIKGSDPNVIALAASAGGNALDLSGVASTLNATSTTGNVAITNPNGEHHHQQDHFRHGIESGR